MRSTISQLENVLKQLGRILPEARLCQLILDAEPEDIQRQQLVTKSDGAIRISGLRFRYSETAPWLFHGFNLNIKSGEYVGITGSSGSGKSTLLRLLLGFEAPTEGYIFYDHFNLQDINKSALRSHCIGAVMQNGRLVEGTLLDNIRFTAPKATDEEVWETVRLVDLEDDIRYSLLLVTWHPKPEGGAFTLALAVDTDLSTAAFGDGLTDGESHTRTLYKFIEFDELFEYQGLFVGGDALAGILAIEVEAIIFGLPSETDMTLGGELHGVGDEISQHLLDAPDVDGGKVVIERVILLEFHVGILYALRQGDTDILES